MERQRSPKQRRRDEEQPASSQTFLHKKNMHHWPLAVPESRVQIAQYEVFHAMRAPWEPKGTRTSDVRTDPQQNKTKRAWKKAFRSLLRRENRQGAVVVVRVAGRLGGVGEERGYFPDRVVRGQVKFVLSYQRSTQRGPVPPSRTRRCAFHRHFIPLFKRRLSSAVGRCCLLTAVRLAEHAQHG